ncbi:hypothetical protein ACFC0M_05780 [Streptomyces sp. NPDC056149]|uniref:hypothetical protein n=1 Tax=Streptomyces sp. NPDC056149 TaxID=3345728 RepID=UPI0035D5BDC8
MKYTRDPAEAREEIRGHAVLARHYRVPALHARLRVPGGYLLAYDRLPSGRNLGLLLDLLNTHEPNSELLAYLQQLATAYRDVILTTARPADPDLVVRKLYWDRAAPGGRLDTYYNAADFLVADGILDIPISHLGAYTLNINGQQLQLDWATTLGWLRTHFSTTKPVWTAITQGDPTDVNLAHPLAWFDYDTAGHNSIAGEFANFLWYVSALGGWLVPTYNPAAFLDHPATFDHVPANTPQLGPVSIDRGTRTVHIDYTPRLTASRRTAVTAYWQQLVQPVAAHLWAGTDLADLLRPYLVMRILGVYNLAQLTPEDRLLLLVRLAEAMSPTFDPATYFSPLESPCPAP